MKTPLIGGIALAAAFAVAPAIAQPVTPPAPATPQVNVQVMRAPMRVHTRDEVVRHVQKMFARLDTNRDGFVTKAEADSAQTAMMGRMHERMAERMARREMAMPGTDRGAAFDRLDSNHDGVITRDEFANARPRMEERRVIVMRGGGQGMAGQPGMMRMHRMGGFGGHLFEMADSNHDGRVSLQEATAMALQHFDMADANHDGKVTPEERMQMHQRMKMQHQPA